MPKNSIGRRGRHVDKDDADRGLEEEGYSAVGAGNGEEALEYLKSAKQKPGLILLDLMMPLMDGWQFRIEQKKNLEFAAIPLVVVTADGNAQQKATKISAEGWIKKPIDIDTLLKVVEKNCH